MSNSQLPANTNEIPPQDWEAFAKIGKFFHLFSFFAVLFGILGFIVGIIFAIIFGVCKFDFGILETPLASSMFVLGKIILLDCYIFILSLSSLIFWKTPESIVPGGRIVRYTVVLFIIGSILVQLIYSLSLVNPVNPVILFFLLWAVIAFIAGYILFLIYILRLATAIDSYDVKQGSKEAIVIFSILIVYIFIISPIMFIIGFMIHANPDTIYRFLFGPYILLCVWAFLSIDFSNLSKDISVFIEIHRQERPDITSQQLDQSMFSE